MDGLDGIEEKKEFRFYANGHPNISARHLTTLEITKDDNLTRRGDCIVAVGAIYDSLLLQSFLKDAVRLVISLECRGKKEVIDGAFNPSFNAGEELVLRRSLFASERTLMIGADRACVDLSRDFVEMIKNPSAAIGITIQRKNNLP